MGLNYLLDTNAAIGYLDDKLPPHATAIVDTHAINLSVITRMELLAWPGSTPEQVLDLQNFIKAGTVHTLNEAVILAAIEIRRDFKPKLPDAIVAATAIVNNFILVTRNEKDFIGIPNLTILNPWT